MFAFKNTIRYIVILTILFLCGMLSGCSKTDEKHSDSLSAPKIIESTVGNQKDETNLATNKKDVENEETPNNSKENLSNLESPKLESWNGNYIFSEFAPPDQNMFYRISISNENGKYFAQLNIDGFQTTVRLKAKVLGDESSIKLVFDEYLPENLFEPYNKGDILLSLKKESEGIYTYWGEIQPILDNNTESGKIYFVK